MLKARIDLFISLTDISIAQSIRCLLLPTTAESYVEKDVRAFLEVVTELWKLTILQEEYNSKNVFKIQSLRDNLEILDGLVCRMSICLHVMILC